MKHNSDQLQSLIRTSIEQYTNILQLMESIKGGDGNLSMEELVRISREILTQQELAAATDKTLLPLLEEGPGTMVDVTGIVKRTELIEKIIQLNKIITPRLANIKSLISNELLQVKQGRSAIKGYQQTEKKHGKNLHKTL